MTGSKLGLACQLPTELQIAIQHKKVPKQMDNQSINLNYSFWISVIL